MGFEPMTSAMPVQCFYQLSYEATFNFMKPTSIHLSTNIIKTSQTFLSLNKITLILHKSYIALEY